MSREVASAAGVPAVYALQADLIAVEALLALQRTGEAQTQLDAISPRIEPRAMSGIWGEFLRVRGRLHAAGGRTTEAYHDFGQSLSVFELLGERYQVALSNLELGRLSANAGARSRAERYLGEASRIFESLNARPDLADTEAALRRAASASTGDFVGPQLDGDDAIVRRLVDASALPELLEREGAAAILAGKLHSTSAQFPREIGTEAARQYYTHL